MARAKSAEPAPKATFVFKGAVRKLKTATMKHVPVDDRTAVVHVDQVLEAPPNLAKYAGKDMINPGSLILSGVMMLRHMKWLEAADAIENGIAKTIQQKRVTYDLERQMSGATKLSTSEFGRAIVENI